MIIIKELVSGKKKFYAKSIVDSDGAESVEFAEYRMTKVEKEGFVYFILYDDEMAVIRPFFRYINYEMAHLSYNTREQSAHALRLLYCYLKLTKSDINRLARKDIISLQYFLLGYSPAKGAYSFRLFTVRRNNTVNDYIGIYRSYFKYAGITCKYIEASRSIEYQSINEIGDITSSKEERFEATLREGTPVRRVPKYISVDEFSKVIKIVRDGKQVCAEIIIRLMYEYGLRIGEVLGITNEDVTEKSIDGMLRPVIYIRNRVSDDKKFQSAKTMLKALTPEIYDSPDYRTEKLGYELIYLTDDFYELLCDFIEVTLKRAEDEGVIERSLADTVVKRKHAPENHYIFLNSTGSPLSSKSWNCLLKGIYEKAGIYIDTEVKKHNLNHRFRHGFAMFQVQHRNINAFELKEMMRHSSLSSTLIYYNPTEDDEYNMKTEFVDELYGLIPTLKEMPDLYGKEKN